MIQYFPYLFLYIFQLLAQFSYPVSLLHSCDLTIWFLLGDKLYDHDGGHVYIFFLERLVFLGQTQT